MRWMNCVFTEAVEMDRAAQRATGVVLTPRLRLTPIGPADGDDLIVLYSDPLVAFWTGPWNPATVQTWATDMATRFEVREAAPTDQRRIGAGPGQPLARTLHIPIERADPSRPSWPPTHGCGPWSRPT